MAATTSGFVTSTTTPPVSPQPGHTSEDHLGSDGLDFDTFDYSPFSIQEDIDDDAPLAQRHLKELNTKLDSLLASAAASSSNSYSEATIKNLFNSLVKEHAANLDKAHKVVDDSNLLNQQTTEKVDKLISQTEVFITDLNTAEGNTFKANEAIS